VCGWSLIVLFVCVLFVCFVCDCIWIMCVFCGVAQSVCVVCFFNLFITQHAPLHSNITCFT